MGKLCRNLSTAHMLYYKVITILTLLLSFRQETYWNYYHHPSTPLSLFLCHDYSLLTKKLESLGPSLISSSPMNIWPFCQFTFMLSLVGSLFLTCCHNSRWEIQSLLWLCPQTILYIIVNIIFDHIIPLIQKL